MTELALLLRFVLAAVFVAAALPKLADRARTADGLRGFGVPRRLADAGAIGLPLAELAVAVALLSGPAGPALAAALGLAAVFTAAQLVALARGRRPACNCFGAGAPIGAATLARSAALGAAAGVGLAVGPGPGAIAWIGDLGAAAQVAVAGAVAVAAVAGAFGWIVLQLLRAQGRMLLRLEALESLQSPEAQYTPVPPAPSRRAPHLSLPTLDGGRATLAGLLGRGRPVVLVFTDSRCAACRSLLPRIAEWQRGPDVTLAVVAAGEPDDLHGVDLALLDDGTVADRYGVAGTPTAVLIDATGRIAAPLATGPVGITALVARAAELAPAAVVGATAPEVALRDADGHPVALPADGRPRLVVFWDETCPACTGAAADLAAWDAALGGGRLLVISRGGRVPAGLAAAVGLDEDDAVTRAFGVRGTPSAVLLDEHGAIAAPVAEGVPAIDVLAGLASREVVPA